MRLEWENILREDIAAFFAGQLEGIIRCPYNVTSFQRLYNNVGGVVTQINNGRVTVPAWVLRGFYPGTNLFFRMTVVDCENSNLLGSHPARYYSNVTIPRIKGRRIVDSHHINGQLVRDNDHKAMENAMLGATHELTKVLDGPKLKMPKCMSPKGMPLLNKRRKNALKKNSN
jgi:(2Fe-2S) ferredoxin